MKKNGLFALLFLITSCSFTQKSPLGRDVAAVQTGNEDLSSQLPPYRVTSFGKNEMRIINDGTAALFERIRMIRAAKKTLELEYFIFNPDSSGRIIINELILASQKGVKVRVLVDKSKAVFVLDEYYAKILSEHNIALRYYNAASIVRISSVQFRNHRKLLIKDDEEIITGGRNIADDYFHLSEEFNFLDRDVWAKGEIVPSIKKTFELFWGSEIVEKPSDVFSNTDHTYGQDKKRLEQALIYAKQRYKEIKKTIPMTDDDRKRLDFIISMGPKKLNENNVYSCPETTFATDREGASFIERMDFDNYKSHYRLLSQEISKWVSEKVDTEILVDTPYFLIDPRSKNVLENLLEGRKKVTLLTNSLASTDAAYVSTVFDSSVGKYTKNPFFNAYTYKGSPASDFACYDNKIKNSQWGTHSKTLVFNDNSFMVGTFNVDNRSGFYNTEMGLFCSGSIELTADIVKSIRSRMKASYHLNAEGVPDDGTPLLFGNTESKKRLYYYLKIPSSLFQFLL